MSDEMLNEWAKEVKLAIHLIAESMILVAEAAKRRQPAPEIVAVLASCGMYRLEKALTNAATMLGKPDLFPPAMRPDFMFKMFDNEDVRSALRVLLDEKVSE